MTSMTRVALAVCLGLAFLIPRSGYAQAFPAKAIRVVVPFSPGGSTDVLARIVAQRMTEAFGQQVVIDNRAGANTIVGTELVTKAAADGYTLLMTIDATVVINPHAYSKLPFDPLKDLAPITKVAALPLIVVAHPSLPFKNAREFIAFAKANPGLSYSSSGYASTAHLSLVLLGERTGARFTHIAYKGGGQAVVDALAGYVPLFVTAVPTVAAYLKSNKLKPVAFTSLKRHHSLPEVQTFAEVGITDYDVTIWYGMFAPAGTPQPTIGRLREEVAKVVANPEARERLAALGADPVGNTPEQLEAEIRADYARWGKIIRQGGIKITE
ncbi:MAG: tripartite tricarboxylate transporter substrate binding protein [Burkholderiales bacterium]|nr:tripartite tricarboxylate transporter substrate binding protein [Burkholderiales bacterium]